nr:preprotein translocase secE subunit [Cryptomonas paramecium]
MLIETFLPNYTNQITRVGFACKSTCYRKFTKKFKYNFNNLCSQKEQKNDLKDNFLQTLMDIKEELWLIKWPVYTDVFKRVIVILIMLSISGFFVYTIDSLMGVANRLFFIKLN